MIIVDSSVWIDMLWGIENSKTIWLNSAFGSEKIGLTTLILCEVLQGIRSEKQFHKSERFLSELPVFDTISPELASRAARNYRFLRAKAITVRNTVDCIIATFCIENGYRLLHADRDFNPFEAYLGLSVFRLPKASVH